MDREVYVVGGANSAGQAALHLARFATRVTLVVRADSLAAGMSQYLVQQVEATPNVDVRVGTEVVDGGGAGRLEHLVLRDRASGRRRSVPGRRAVPHDRRAPAHRVAPAGRRRDERGFIVTGDDLDDDGSPAGASADRLRFETSMPGVLAAGDVRQGSVKRVASAVGEGSVAIQMLHQLFAGGAPDARAAGPRGVVDAERA